jgi:ribonuclease HI
MRTARLPVTESQYTEQPVQIHTDGSASAKLRDGGWAFVAKWGAVKRERYGSEETGATNITMEVTAILRAFEYVRPAPLRRLHVITDSEWTVNAMTKWWQQWKASGWRTASGKQVANLELLVRLKAAMDFHRKEGTHVMLSWVRGHSGVRGNERADVLAGEARTGRLSNWDEITDAKLKWCDNRKLYLPDTSHAPHTEVLRGRHPSP